MNQILLDESLKAKGYIIPHLIGSHKIDLSKINFDVIKKRLVAQRKHIEAEKLKNLLSQKLIEMARLNKIRSKFLEKFQKLVDEYNAGAINVEVFFNRLKDFTKDLNEEDKRGLSENLTEEELAIFDLLYKPDLTKKDKDKVKLVSKTLLEKLKREKLVLEWRKKQQTRADVLLTIQDVLDNNLPDSYTPPIYQEKCNLIYQHIYDSYFGKDKSIYTVTT